MRSRKYLLSVVKTIMQKQVAIANGCLQLRSDHYLTHAKGLSPDAIARLRHASALEDKRLFPPPDVRKEVDDNNQKHLQTKAFLRFAAASTSRQRSGRGKADGDFRTGYHPSALRRAQYQQQYTWYGMFYSASSTPVPVSCVPPQKQGAQNIQ